MYSFATLSQSGSLHANGGICGWYLLDVAIKFAIASVDTYTLVPSLLMYLLFMLPDFIRIHTAALLTLQRLANSTCVTQFMAIMQQFLLLPACNH